MNMSSPEMGWGGKRQGKEAAYEELQRLEKAPVRK